MELEVTGVFDIGKTNKKFFLFDANFEEVYREYTQLDLIEDEDGYPTEDLEGLCNWIKGVFERTIKSKEYSITALNFSTYGASLVHLDEFGEPLTPLYNYTKPYPEEIRQEFFQTYGPKNDFLKATGSDDSGMLNSGLQLYWLKRTKPEIFKRIKFSIHLPQYLSYIFTGIPVSEYTSIGCHTGMWDYGKKDYHDWIYKENLAQLLPKIVPTETSLNMNYDGHRIKIGVGIHDSSAALLPYVRSSEQPFILLSTGTWSIAFNPYQDGQLTDLDIADDCINYMRINGKSVKASRLFLGNEYREQVAFLTRYYDVDTNYHRTVKFDYDAYYDITKDFEHIFSWYSLKSENMPHKTVIKYTSFEHAYHHLMIELVMLQLGKIKKISSLNHEGNLYIDGGFSDNDIYINLLSHSLRNMKIMTTDSSLGSAIGAAVVISDKKLNSKFLKKNYALKKHVPFIIK
ncbi:FGGY-family carbohydrate kinase [Muricauda amoyensis]|uniref:FGGY-family carbohydrate kinase n=1 Tax=Flagellimonas amoyensis TaxID=2169401 RepID=UPI000D38A88A|nr:FGGY family carbohydrate kinase [Allomuricauda amoyensis]